MTIESTESQDVAMKDVPTSSSVKRKRSLVDEAFERMFGYDWEATEVGDDKKVLDESIVGLQLAEMFGRKRAKKVLAMIPEHCIQPITTTLTKPRHKAPVRAIPSTQPLFPKSTSTPQPTPTVSSSLNDDKKAPKTSNSATTSSTQAASASATAKPPPPLAKPTTNLDNVLAQLSGPVKQSTMQKTNRDWESFKESDKLLQDELESHAKGKNAFLVKQDFLQRVDHRKFELEKDQRARERATRDAS
eukprot:Nitzschia sp. Nitz4//scaffold24_size164493//29909//30646//NITZ4_002310-RA/size164493-processed-gene-0.221-mRNA-1//-1//CDS//3329544060//7362//frame0